MVKYQTTDRGIKVYLYDMEKQKFQIKKFGKETQKRGYVYKK